MILARANAPLSGSWVAMLPRLSALHPIRHDGGGGLFYAHKFVTWGAIVSATRKEVAHERQP